MKKLSIKLSAEANTEAAKAWEIVGPNFLNISQWGRGILKSYNNDAVKPQFENAPAGGRFCDVIGFGTFDEKIIHYNDKNYEISWSAQGQKLPGFVKGLQNQIKVEQIDQNTCRLTSHISADLTGIMGFFMGGMMEKNFTKQIGGFLKDWKTYAETGDISEAKKREIAKNK